MWKWYWESQEMVPSTVRADFAIAAVSNKQLHIKYTI